MSEIQSFVAGNFRCFSMIITIVTVVVSIIIRARKKHSWKDLGFDLADYVSIILSAYTIPTGLLLIVCCTDVKHLSVVTEIWLYLVISGIALIYTAFSSIMNKLKE